MSRLLANDTLGLVVRVFLGAVFIVASIEKMADPAAFTVSIENYRLLPHGAALTAATILPWIELLCGFALMFGVYLRGGAILTLLMLALFTGAIISGLLRGLDISCGCFTQDPDVSKIGWFKVLENIGLILLSFFTWISTGTRYVLQRVGESRS